jgi:3-phenylpropionate/trans-cinnamate dioxygenase ferredoxin subunit
MTAGIRVASFDDIPEGGGVAVSRDIAGTDDHIALLRDRDGHVWALNDTCPHETASLAEGWVDHGQVECPLHASRFCLKDGTVQHLPATRNTVAYRVEVRDGDVYLYGNEQSAN